MEGRAFSPVVAKLVLRRFDRLDHHVLAHRAAVFEDDAPADLGKERVVFAAADVEPGLHTGAALAHDDGSARNDLSAERLKSEPLRIRIAAIS